MNQNFADSLPITLQARLNSIIQTLPSYWQAKRYNHFTNQGITHSERVYKYKLAYLAQELPGVKRLSNEEIFIISAAAWLYEIGMQTQYLEPTLHINQDNPSPSDLLAIRQKKHLLSERLILGNYNGPALPLGLMNNHDDYEKVIATVCRFMSDEPFEAVPETMAVMGMPVRVRLMVALLRLADQLYIDSSRISIEDLLKAKLPLRDMAKWWVFNYVQTLPINNNKIPFSYFLPLSQKEYLPFIRGFIERTFERQNNPQIKYLWETGLILVPQDEPMVQLDQYESSHFQNPMPADILYYLRSEIQPIHPAGIVPSSESKKSVLVIDVEGFILQMGEQGFFFIEDEIYRLLVSILNEAKKKFGGRVEGYALGHWDRPDLLHYSEELKKRTYQPIDLSGLDKNTVVSNLLKGLQKNIEGSTNLIFVTPNVDYAIVLKEFHSPNVTLNIWGSGLQEAEIFQIVSDTFEEISSILVLKNADVSDKDEREQIKLGIILRIDSEIANNSKGLRIEELRSCIEQVIQNINQVNWWSLYLLSDRLVILNEQGLYFLNKEHTDIVALIQLRKSVFDSFQELSPSWQSVPQITLLTKLRIFFKTDQHSINFLNLLKDEEYFRKEVKRSESEDVTYWRINQESEILPYLYPDRFLKQLILAFDQILIRDLYPYLRNVSLANKLSTYVSGLNIFKMVVTIAEDEKILLFQASLDHPDDPKLSNVSLNHSDPRVCETLRNRDIIINCLRRKSSGLQAREDELYQKLNNIRAFTVKKNDLELFINVLCRDDIITLVDTDLGKREISLNITSPIVHRMIGRLYLPGLVRTMRVMRATNIGNQKPRAEMISSISRYVTSNDDNLANWAFEYAENIKLVTGDNNTDQNRYLNNHSFVRNLDRREAEVTKAVLELVRNTKCDSQGWIPRHVVIHSMGNDFKFGYTMGENDYWLDQAIFRMRYLEEKKVRQEGILQSYVRAVH